MAGGVFYRENKVRPGAYINFKKAEDELNLNSSRGIVAVALELDWGAENSLISITPTNMNSGAVLAKLGFMANDSTALPLNLILQNARLAKVYRLNGGGNKATKTIGNLTVTAKHSGTFGNKIAILITSANSIYTVTTYADGYEVDVQKATTINDLVDNDFVTFTGTGTFTTTQTSTLLTGGTNGSYTASTAFAAFFTLLRTTNWQVLAICNNSATVNPLMTEFIKSMRNDEGKYVQGVVANYSSADYEGLINNVNGVTLEDGTSVSAEMFTTYVAGITAGASATESNTGKVIKNAVAISGQLTDAEIKAGLEAGKFILSSNQDGSIKVEKDINSLHTYTDDLDYNFTKNKVIRVLDEIGTRIEGIWETTYLGKVANNADGRDLFKASIITFLQDFQNQGAIQDFNGADDVMVEAGENIDAVTASIRVKPVDAMEYLYMTVNVVE